MTNTQITALITAIQDNGQNTALEVRTVLTAIKNACVLPNEIKWIKMPQGDISTYFVTTGGTTGLGIAGQLYEGWAICNGNNLTTNDAGRASIAYGTGYTTLGEIGGSKDSVVVSHTHTYERMVATTVGDQSVPAGTTPYYTPSPLQTTSNASNGVSGTDKNMQPYVVELKIQRIA